MELKNRYALITGGAKRIGKAIALKLAEAGCHIYLHYNSSEEDALQTAEEIKALGVQCIPICCDLTDTKELNETLLSNNDLWDHCSILVNSASQFFPSTDPDESVFMTLHYKVPALLINRLGQNAAAVKRQVNAINLTDAMLKRPDANYSAYYASKAALEELTRTAARQWSDCMRVNAVAPGCILFAASSSEERNESIVQTIPLKRIGQADDIANACLFLIGNNYITGQTLTVDAGRSL